MTLESVKVFRRFLPEVKFSRRTARMTQSFGSADYAFSPRMRATESSPVGVFERWVSPTKVAGARVAGGGVRTLGGNPVRGKEEFRPRSNNEIPDFAPRFHLKVRWAADHAAASPSEEASQIDIALPPARFGRQRIAVGGAYCA